MILSNIYKREKNIIFGKEFSFFELIFEDFGVFLFIWTIFYNIIHIL